MVSPASWLFSWLSFQVPEKGFCAPAVPAVAKVIKSQKAADKNRPGRIGPPLLRLRTAIRALLLLACYAWNIKRERSTSPRKAMSAPYLNAYAPPDIGISRLNPTRRRKG